MTAALLESARDVPVPAARPEPLVALVDLPEIVRAAISENRAFYATRGYRQIDVRGHALLLEKLV